MIFMKHPGLPEAEPATTTQAAFDKVWAEKGWVQVDPDQARAERSKPQAAAPAPKPRHTDPPTEG